MSRLRRFNKGLMTNETSYRSVDDHEVPNLPMDTDEQEELIQRFELNNSLRNRRYVNILSLTFLLFSGFCLIRASKAQGREMALLVLEAQSVICTTILTRYELTHNYPIYRSFSIYIDNSKIQGVNIILLVLIEWIGLSCHTGWRSLLFRNIPFILFVISKTLKRWSTEIEQELNELRNMKYKYKNA